jgi:hypothetical protein
MPTRRIWIITEVVEGGKPSSTYIPDEDNPRQKFKKMVKELGYSEDDDHAWDSNDPDRNFIALDYITIPA